MELAKEKEEVLTVNKDNKGVGDLKAVLAPDIEIQSLELAQLVSCLVLRITVK